VALSASKPLDVIFDGIMQIGKGLLVPLWVFSRTAPGVTLFPGEQAQYPLYDLLAIGSMIMWSTYILGRRDAAGNAVVESWVHRWTRDGWQRTLATAASYILLTHALYLYVFAPHFITGRPTCSPRRAN
jgi:Spirocyclase AveC-like